MVETKAEMAATLVHPFAQQNTNPAHAHSILAKQSMYRATRAGLDEKVRAAIAAKTAKSDAVVRKVIVVMMVRTVTWARPVRRETKAIKAERGHVVFAEWKATRANKAIPEMMDAKETKASQEKKAWMASVEIKATKERRATEAIKASVAIPDCPVRMGTTVSPVRKAAKVARATKESAAIPATRGIPAIKETMASKAKRATAAVSDDVVTAAIVVKRVKKARRDSKAIWANRATTAWTATMAKMATRDRATTISSTVSSASLPMQNASSKYYYTSANSENKQTKNFNIIIDGQVN